VTPRNGLVAVIKCGSVVLVGALGYALFATAYNGLVGEQQLEVVAGAIRVAILGPASLLGLWIYRRDRQKRGQ